MTAVTAASTLYDDALYDEALPDFSKTYTIGNILARRSAFPGGITMAGCFHVVPVILLMCMASFASQSGSRPSVAGPPEASISNGLVRAKLYLPDAENGYYRGTRFDWSGVIASLEYQGHNYFGQWFPRYDPKLHDSISGPVEEYTTGGSALNYTDAKPGETFVKIGVGVLKKPDEPRYAFRNPYEILDSGKWDVRSRPDAVEFSQELDDPKSGYAYVYRKTVRLATAKPQLVLEHNLKNTGRKVIETSVYNHNFLVIDGQPSGPDFSVSFPFEIKGASEMPGLAEARGNRIVYLKTLEERQTARTAVEGFGGDAKDYDIRVENRKTGAGVRILGDRPLARIAFWSIRTTLCPEAFIEMKIEPGKDFSWRITYDFYTLPERGEAGKLGTRHEWR